MYIWIHLNLCITVRWADGWLIKYSGSPPALPDEYKTEGIGVGLDRNCTPPMATLLVYRKDGKRLQRRELEQVLRKKTK